jgi:pimeloyl-ACP methyl ester carboxylesterase
MTRSTKGRAGPFRPVAAVAALLTTGSMLLLPGTGAQASPPVSATPATSAASTTVAARSTRSEAAKLDAVPTPKLHWYACYTAAQCTTVKVPLDYDHPDGPKVELALLRLKARDPKHRIGSLFVNPGGPGGSATGLAYFSDSVLSEKVLDRFDIVGMDPRGIAYSDNVTCLSPRTQDDALAGYDAAFPLGAKQEKAWIASDKALGKACSKNTLARSMSTAEVARDMELMRRAVGDKKLSYLGFSYGTYLGQVYANMFPDRFRAIAVDGVLDPVAWAGNKTNAAQPLEARLDSAAGAYKALHEILVRCDRAGGTRCSFATGDPVTNLEVIADRLKAKPAVVSGGEDGDSYTITYSDMVGQMLGDLYDPTGYQDIVDTLSSLSVLTEPPNPAARTSDARRAAATSTLTRLHRDQQAGRPRWSPGSGRPGHDFSYDNSLDAFASVTCTDSTEATTSSQYPAFAVQADKRAPYFGRAWLWGSSVCAGDAFTGRDEDAYTGPFDTKTKAPVLYVGDYYDPATNYDAAVSASKRMPNSRLLTSDSFGHTAYGTSSCTTKAVDDYLLEVP